MCRPTTPMIGLGALFWAFLGFAIVLNPWTTPYFPTSGMGALILSPQSLFLVAFAIIVRVKRLSLPALGVNTERLGLRMTQGLLLGLAPIFLTLLGVALLVLLGGPRLWEGESLPFHLSLEQALLLWVLAPLTEELFFRGLLFPALRETYPMWVAVLGSSIIFMAGHGGFKVGPLILGLITAPLVARTRSLWPAIIFHAISNTYVPLLLTQLPRLYRRLTFLF